MQGCRCARQPAHPCQSSNKLPLSSASHCCCPLQGAVGRLRPCICITKACRVMLCMLFTATAVIWGLTTSLADGRQAAETGFFRTDTTVIHAQYRGRLDAPSITRALCAGFSESSEPSMCLSGSLQASPLQRGGKAGCLLGGFAQLYWAKGQCTPCSSVQGLSSPSPGSCFRASWIERVGLLVAAQALAVRLAIVR